MSSSTSLPASFVQTGSNHVEQADFKLPIILLSAVITSLYPQALLHSVAHFAENLPNMSEDLGSIRHTIETKHGGTMLTVALRKWR